MILSYDEALAYQALCIGNKAWRQAQLYAMGIRVPPGCIAYLPSIADLDIAKLYEQLEHLFGDTLQETCILRSSAALEDGTQSFSGIYQSMPFDVGSFTSFERAVQLLIDSYRSDDANQYMMRLGIKPEEGQFSALIQKVIPATSSGIAYSHDPISTERRTIIESTFGLNVVITDGRISPDSIIVDSAGTIIASVIGKKKVFACPKDGIIEIKPMEPAKASKLSLTDSQINTLQRTVDRLYRHIGMPQDIEWAFHNDLLYILQCRKITGIGDCEHEVSI